MPKSLNTFLSWLTTLSPIALLSGVLGYFLVASLILAAVQVLIPELQSAFEIILGILGIVIVFIGLRYAWALETSQLTQSRRFWFSAILVFSILFQLAHWYVDGGSLNAELGDDDEIYILLAHQITGQIEGPPIFTYRPPGVPLLLATTLKLGGLQNIWVFSLIQRLMLAVIPPLLFLILIDWVPEYFAVLGSLLFLTTRINEHEPFFVLSQLPYTVFGMIGLTTLVIGIKRSGYRRVLWIIAAGLFFAIKTLIRPTGAATAPALAIVLLLVATDLRWLQRLGLAFILIFMTGAVLVGLRFTNQQVAGEATISSLGGLNVINHFIYFDPSIIPLSESPEKEYFEELLPEIEPDLLFSSTQDWYTARFRAALLGPEVLAQFSAHADALAAQIVAEHPLKYSTWIIQKTYAGLMFPRHEGIPLLWYRPELAPQRFNRAPYQSPILECSSQFTVKTELLDIICEENYQVRNHSNFEPQLPSIPQPIEQGLHLMTISLAFRLRLILWVFTWGFASLAGVLWLVSKNDTRPCGWVLGAAFAAEFIPTVLLGVASTRYQLPYHPIFFLISWIALSQLAKGTFQEKSLAMGH